MNDLSPATLWRIISLASAIVVLAIVAPSCFTSDECRDGCEDETGTETGTGETGDPQ